MIPAAIVWGTFAASIVLSFVAPVAAVVFIIIFDLYWMLRVLYFILHLFVAYRQYHATVRVNWYEKLQQIAGWDQVYHVVMLPTFREEASILRETIGAIARGPYRTDRMIGGGR